MKKPIIIFSLLVSLLVSLFPTTALAQQSGTRNAIYIYRNDGDFNAFLNCDIDSITYSKFDLEGKEHPVVVVQEVVTNDSIYRIPLEAIDSIAFTAPEPVLKSDLFYLTEEHIPYVQSVSDLTVDFDLSIPSNMLPGVGQVVVSDVDGEPFDGGFAGKVTSVATLRDRIHMECENASIDDIYDQLVCVGKSVGYSDGDSTIAELRGAEFSGVKTFYIGNKSIPLLSESYGTVALNVSPRIELNYAICYKVKGKDNSIKVEVKPIVDCSLNYNWQRSGSKSYKKEIASIKIKTGVPLLFANVTLGAFLDLNGSVNLDASLPFTVSAKAGYDSQKPKGQRFYYDKSLTVSAPNGSVTFSGSAHAGLSVGFGVYLVTRDIAEANITVKAGPRITGNIQFNTSNTITDAFYNSFKDSKIILEPLVGKLEANVYTIFKGGESKTLAEGSLLGSKDYYLFPAFTGPHLPDLSSTGYSLTALTTEVSRNLIFSVYPGIRLYNSYGNAVATVYSSKSYKKQADWNNRNLQMDLKNYSPATYSARPVFKFWSATVTANPKSTVKVPQPFTLSSTNVCVKRGYTKYISINNGWGSYYIVNSDYSVCTATLSGSQIKIVAKKNGTAKIKVVDKRSGKQEVATIIVNDTGNQPNITVSSTSLSFGRVVKGNKVEETFTVKGTNLTGNLTLTASGSYYSITPKTITKADAASGVTVTVTYRPSATGNHTGSIIIKDGDATSKTVSLSGTCVNSSNPNTPGVYANVVEPDEEQDDEPDNMVCSDDIDASPQTWTGMDELSMDVKIYYEGQNIIIETPVEQSAIISDIAGHARSVCLRPGRNEIPVNASGIHIVRVSDKTVKLMLK